MVSTSDILTSDTLEHLIKPQTAQDVTKDVAQAESTEKLADKSKNTSEQQSNSGQNLAERVRKQCPQWVDSLLGFWHVVQLLLAVVDGPLHLVRQRLQ